MSHIVTITTQGQISIPAAIRRQIGLDKTRKAFVSTVGKKIVVEPIPDLLELEGALHKYAIKNKPIEEVMAMEEQAAGEAFAQRYRKKSKKRG